MSAALEAPAIARRALLLAIADDELITGHRASHWTGVAPSVEEDLAFSTIAQDEINHADVWYQVLLAGEGRASGGSVADDHALRESVDALGLGREPNEYRHAVLCERPPRDFAWTLARHWAYDHADQVRLDALAGSSDGDVAAVASRLRHEERYHLEHADLWFRRLTRGTEEQRERFGAALADVLAEAPGLFEAPEHEDVAVDTGLLPVSHAGLFTRWAAEVTTALDAADLAFVVPAEVRTGNLEVATPGGRRGVHTDDFTLDVWPEMTHLYRAHPGATW
jgi:ring-1,2-phenylacetyl-CoA epoxidase subunit PaaC